MLCYILPKPKGPVLQNTFEPAVATSTDKRGFVTSRICRGGPSTPTFMGGMARVATPGARLVPCFEHPVHPHRFKTVRVGCQSQPGATHMTQVIPLASRRAAPNTTPTEAELVQLHARACNALHTALHHLNSPDCSPAMWAAATARAHRGLAALKQASALANRVEG